MHTLAADADIWRFQAHPEVWLIVVAIIGFGWWVTQRLAPKALPAGHEPVTRFQKGCFVAALVLLWLISDWPVHDISEEYLYLVHMAQHLALTLIVPPLFLLATPEWLARLVVSNDGSSGVWVKRLTRPVAAAVLFNVLVALTHLTWVVNTSIEIGAFHYFVHLTVFTAALLMWMPVVSPLPELRASYPGQMIFLFLNSVLPTVPGGFLTFAEAPLYRVYDHPIRAFGISAVDDQQAAGLIMKLGGGIIIWSLIAFLFFRWVMSERTSLHPDEATIRERSGLTYEAVTAAFDKAGEPVSEPPSGAGTAAP